MPNVEKEEKIIDLPSDGPDVEVTLPEELIPTLKQEEDVLEKTIALIEQTAGRRPVGYVAPLWEFQNVTIELLIKHGFLYDHCLMHNDFLPYYVRVGDSWTNIDYRKSAKEWMLPLVRGQETSLVEIPANW